MVVGVSHAGGEERGPIVGRKGGSGDLAEELCQSSGVLGGGNRPRVRRELLDGAGLMVLR